MSKLDSSASQWHKLAGFMQIPKNEIDEIKDSYRTDKERLRQCVQNRLLNSNDGPSAIQAFQRQSHI